MAALGPQRRCRPAAAAAEITTLRQELAAAKARIQEMGRHNAICRRIDDWVSIMTTGHAAPSDKTNELGRWRGPIEG
jgi:hypothetical protein